MGFFGAPDVENLEAKRDVKGLIKALGHQNDAKVRRDAARALGEIGDVRAVGPLITALGDPEWFVRGTAAVALGKIKDVRALEPLIVALKEREAGVSAAAAEALGEIGDVRAAEPLVAALDHDEVLVRHDATEALGKIGGTRAVEPLIAALKDQRSTVRTAAAGALDRLAWSPDRGAAAAAYWAARSEWGRCVEIGATHAVELLIIAIKDESNRGRDAASRELRTIDDPRAVTRLIAALKDSDGAVSSSAAVALGGIRDARAVGPLVDAFKGGRVGAWPLGQFADPRVVEPLIAVLGDGDHLTNGHEQAAEALGRIRDPRAVEPLIAALKLRHPSDRIAVARALGEIGDTRAIPALREVASSEDDGVWDDGMYYGDGGAFIGAARRALEQIEQRSDG